MKIVVIGGTGLIGSKVVQNLQTRGHDVVAASPTTGVDTMTGDGLDAALAGADAVVDLSNSPSFENAVVLEFFETSGRNLFLRAIADSATEGDTVRVPSADRPLHTGSPPTPGNCLRETPSANAAATGNEACGTRHALA